MNVTPIHDPAKARLRARLVELKRLRAAIDDEVLVTDAELRALTGDPLPRRHPDGRPPCGTDEGYHWHRYQDAGTPAWPLPADDPCGCRAAHASRERLRLATNRVYARRVGKPAGQRAGGGAR